MDGRCTRIYGSFQDIDERKRAELETLSAIEEKDRILESIGDAFFAVNKEWTVTYWNDRAEEVLSRPRREILHRNMWEVYADAVGTPFYTYTHKAIAENAAQHFVACYETLGIWFEVSAFPSPGGLSVFFRDVTGRKQSELVQRELNQKLQAYTEELVASNKGLEQFSYIVSHNLRAPVANIIGLGELLRQEGYPAEAKKTFLDGLLENVWRLDTVIRDLNTMLQAKKGLGERTEPVNLAELVEDIQGSIHNLMEESQVQIITDFGIGEFSTIRSYLQSIFHNLITNSIKYGQPGVPPIIEIGSRLSQAGVVITYRDNGLGIDLEKRRNQVFGLYKRFHRHVEGKGMGLFMVKTQVEALGGKISVSSEVNKGTEFTMEFKLLP
nr:PAS domain-containing sensor histidine kinase [Rufibacter tibetensis]